MQPIIPEWDIEYLQTVLEMVNRYATNLDVNSRPLKSSTNFFPKHTDNPKTRMMPEEDSHGQVCRNVYELIEEAYAFVDGFRRSINYYSVK
jgi:hypothetical protein